MATPLILAPHGPSGTGGEQRLHLRDLLQVLSAHWLAVVAVTALVLAAAWWTGRDTIQRYQAQAVIQVNSRKGILPMLNDIDVEEMALRTDPVASEALVLTTQTLGYLVADRVGLQLQVAEPGVRRGAVMTAVRTDSVLLPDSFALQLKGRAGWELRDARGQLVSSGGYEAPATGPGFSFSVVPSDDQRTVRLAVIPRVSAATMVRTGISYQVQPSTNIVTVTYTGTDASLVPLVLNAAVVALGDYGANRVRGIADNRLRYINERIEEARRRYQASLAAVQHYEEQQATSDLSAEELALINSIQEYERERQRREVDLGTIRSILGESTQVNLETVNRLAAIAPISTNPAMGFQLENLLRLYDERRNLTSGPMGLRDNNPQIVSLDQRIAQSSQGLVDATKATVRSLETTLAAIEQQIRGLRRQLASFPGRRSQYQQLALDAEMQNDTYKFLLSQFEAARIQSASISPYVQVIETAIGSAPIGVNTRQKLLIGLLVGLFLGVVAAFFLEYLDQTIRTSGDIDRTVGLPVLGVIPQEARAGGNAGRSALPLVSLTDPDDPASEAYRALRTNVTFASAGQTALQLILVTSPGPAEGKSTTASNLAITLAQQGARTLLVDADLRRPIVHRAFNLVQEPGLTDLLVGRAQLREAIRPNVAPKLDVLPAGALPPNPSELLGSESMRRLLAQLRSSYDTVVFDSPPVLPVTDATVLGAATDGVILVLRSGETEEVVAQRAAEQLRRLAVRIAGTVLNGVEKGRDRYYNHYYRYGRQSRRHPLAALRHRLASLV